jgi:hypothetical protein
MPTDRKLIPAVVAVVIAAALAWNSTPRESPNAGDAYPIHLTQDFGPERY